MASLARCTGCSLLVEDGTNGCLGLFETMVGQGFSDIRHGRWARSVWTAYAHLHPLARLWLAKAHAFAPRQRRR